MRSVHQIPAPSNPARRAALRSLSRWVTTAPTPEALPVSAGRPPRPARPRAPKGGCIVAGRFYRGGVFLPASPAPEPAPAPVKLAITGFVYEARPVAVAPEIGTVAFELHKLDTGNHYHVLRDNSGIVSCDCGDYLFRHDGTGQLCKHGSALVSRGLVPAPSPVATTLGRREFLTPLASILRPAAPDRLDYPARPRRFEPSPEERAEAAQIFGELVGGGC